MIETLTARAAAADDAAAMAEIYNEGIDDRIATLALLLFPAILTS